MKAGQSFPKNTSGLTNTAAPVNSWNDCNAENFQLRIGPNYKKNQKKDKSPVSLMELIGVDCVTSAKRIDNFGAQVVFPQEWNSTYSNGTPNGYTELLSQLPADFPFIFIVNVQLPSEFPTSVFREITDGPGWSLVFYYRWTEAALRSILSQTRDANNTAAKLLAQYLRAATPVSSDYGTTVHTTPVETPEFAHKFKGRFKVILNCNNIDEFGLPSFITSYNAKPVLIRNTGILIKSTNPFTNMHYVEFDINVHRFSSVPKKALQILLGRFDKMFIDAGFCIESREDEEMPETILGCATLNRPVSSEAPQFS